MGKQKNEICDNCPTKEITQKISNMERNYRETFKKISAIDEAIRGNGKEGLNTKMARVDTTIRVLKWAVMLMFTMFTVFVTIYFSR